MTATSTPPKITASVLRDAATRLTGAVVLLVEDMTVGPAVYRARLAAFETIDGQQIGEDDGTVVVLVQPGVARDLIEEHRNAARAAIVINRQLRAEWASA